MSTDTIRIMISSRSSTTVFDPPVKLKDLRQSLKKYIIENLTLSGEPLFDVWICEEDTGRGIDSWWKTSRDEVRDADLLMVLYTGEAGSQVKDVGLGICHAELYEAVQFSREKILPIINISNEKLPGKPQDIYFQNYVNELNIWPNSPTNEDELQNICAQSLLKGIVRLTKRAIIRRKGASFDLGNALDWSKLDFAARKQKIEGVLLNFLDAKGGKNTGKAWDNGSQTIVVNVEKTPVLWCLHAIPATTSIAAARELVGQPFINDHLAVPLLKTKKAIGPVHLIGCHKSITESQALKIRGVADCTVVKTDFGIYLADNIQKIQIFFLANCRDLTATQSAITEMFRWVEQSDEGDDIVKRAKSRTKILTAIANEI